MLLPELFDPGRDFIQGLAPGDPFKAAAHAFQRVLQPARVILEESDAGSFPTDETPGTGTFPVRPDFEDPAARDNDFQAAVLSAKYAGSLLPFIHMISPSQEITAG
jgi:hypothetical protein